MRAATRALVFCVLTFLPAAAGCGGSEQSTSGQESVLRVGMAVEEITPDLERFGTLRPLAYLFNPPVRGVKDRLHARAMVLDNGRSRVAWVALDTTFVDSWLCDLVYARTTCLPRRDCLLVTAVHNHGGIAHIQEQPLFEFLFGEKKPALREEVAARVALAVERAASDLQPARVNFASAPVAFMNQNRRPFYHRGFEDLGTDPELSTLVFVDSRDEAVATIVNFAAHPTLTPTWEDPHFTADFVGVFNDSVERALGGGLTFREGGRFFCMFTNGVEGDAEPYYPDPVEREVQTWEKPREYASQLAEAALPVIEWAREESGSPETVLETSTLSLPMPQIVPAHPLISMALVLFPIIPREIPMATLRLGNVLVSFFPGEPTTPVGLGRIKMPLAAASGLKTILVSLSNDYISYVPSPEQYRESAGVANYERFICMFGPRTGEILAEAAMASAQGLTGR